MLGWKDRWVNEGRSVEGQWDYSRVADRPAQIAFCDGHQSVVGDAQGYAIDISPRLSLETGMEIIRHALGVGDPGWETKEQLEWKLTSSLRSCRNMQQLLQKSQKIADFWILLDVSRHRWCYCFGFVLPTRETVHMSLSKMPVLQLFIQKPTRCQSPTQAAKTPKKLSLYTHTEVWA